MLKKIAIVLVLLIVAGVVFVAMQSEDYKVSRTVAMKAPPEVVFDQVNTPKNWEAWSPFHKIDPKMTLTYDGPSSGKGASYSWVGNSEAGEGKYTIVESKPNELVVGRLEFKKPFEMVADQSFVLVPKNDQTEVTWNMSGKRGFVFKAMHLIMGLDKTIGGEFEKGLTSLKGIVEKSPGEAKTDEKK